MTAASEAARPGWQRWVQPFSAALATAAVIWGVQAVVVPARQALARDPAAATTPRSPLPGTPITAGPIP